MDESSGSEHCRPGLIVKWAGSHSSEVGAHIELLTRLIEIFLFSDRLVRSGKSISRRQILISSLLSCLGGGVLLATTMIHILPEVTENLKEQAEKIELESLPQLVVCAGGKYI